MSKGQEFAVTTTFFVCGEWSLVETADSRLKILRGGKVVERCDWAGHEMYRAVGEFRKRTGRHLQQADDRP